MIRVGDRVRMRDRYRTGIHRFEPSWWHGLRGVVTSVSPTLMVHLQGERLPMVMDPRDCVVEEPDEISMTGAE